MNNTHSNHIPSLFHTMIIRDQHSYYDLCALVLCFAWICIHHVLTLQKGWKVGTFMCNIKKTHNSQIQEKNLLPLSMLHNSQNTPLKKIKVYFKTLIQKLCANKKNKRCYHCCTSEVE